VLEGLTPRLQNAHEISMPMTTVFAGAGRHLAAEPSQGDQVGFGPAIHKRRPEVRIGQVDASRLLARRRRARLSSASFGLKRSLEVRPGNRSSAR